MSEFSVQERNQRLHYDTIAADYERHYSDEYSQHYRQLFFYEPMTRGIPLAGKKVLDAMCGSGQSIPYLLSQGALVTGLDISTEVIKDFQRKWPECDTVQASIFNSGIPDASFDCVLVVGGLHHLNPHVDDAIDEIHRILKPGGYLCFVEPHATSLMDVLRRAWYRVDGLFESSESAIHVRRLEARHAGRFTFESTRYLGNLAYLLVFNSMVFRIPVRLKRLYSPLLMQLEAALNRVTGERLACFVVAQWRKRG